MTRDHVFVDALGGHSTVGACRACNSRIGSEIEGRLQAANSILGLLKQVRGGGQPIRATVVDTGLPITYDFATGEMRAAKPVAASRKPGRIVLEMQGSPAQVRTLLRQQGIPEPEIDSLIAGARPALPKTIELRTEILHDLDLADRLTAKVLLGAGTLGYGHAFVTSTVADSLRDIVWGRTSVTKRISLDALAGLDEMLVQSLIDAGVQEPPRLSPHGAVSQAVFINRRESAGSHEVLMFVHIAGVPISGSGIVCEGTPPIVSSLPMLVRDGLRGAEIISFETELRKGAGHLLSQDMEPI